MQVPAFCNFPTMFSKGFLLRVFKSGYCDVRLITYFPFPTIVSNELFLSVVKIKNHRAKDCAQLF